MVKHRQHFPQAPGGGVCMGKLLHFKRYHWSLKKKPNCESNCLSEREVRLTVTGISHLVKVSQYHPRWEWKPLGWYWSSPTQTLCSSLHATLVKLNVFPKSTKPKSFAYSTRRACTWVPDQQYCNGHTLTLGDTEKPSPGGWGLQQSIQLSSQKVIYICS